MRITLNLATRPYADLRPALKSLRIAMAVLAVIALGLGLGLRAFHQKAEEARATDERVQKQIDAINRERLGYQEMMRQPANAELLIQAAALNQLFNEKIFSWTLAMEDLETVLPGGVQVTTIEPKRAKDGHITLSLRVVGPRDHADDLVENLEHSKHFLLPNIVGESSESTGGANEKLAPISASNRFTFELLADYNSAVLMEPRARKKLEGEKPAAGVESDQKPAQKTLPPSRAAHSPGFPAAQQPGFSPSQQPGRGLGFHGNPGGPNPNTKPSAKPHPGGTQ
jgi:type IV pilus assembly protein PilN